MHAYTRFKTWLAAVITAGVSTMECAFLFTALAIYGFPGLHATPTAYVQWVSQTFIQLVMLSILAVQANITQGMHAHHKQEIASLHLKIDALAPKPRSPQPPRPRDTQGRFIRKEHAA